MKSAIFKLMGIFLIVEYFIFCQASYAKVTLESNEPMGMEGLYFWYSDPSAPVYTYNRNITPKGDCFDIINGYAFLTWYKGGMQERNLMVSRMKLGTNHWVTIEFPETNTLYTGVKNGVDYSNSPGGDSHRTTAIGISSKDGTIHLVFDQHAGALNYRRSKKNIAFGPDSMFTLDNFLPKQNYFKSGEPITSCTYPNFTTNDAGELILNYRNGTARQGDMTGVYYNGDVWSSTYKIIKGNNVNPQFNTYGGLYYFNGTMYMCGAIRVYGSEIELNQGIYFGKSGQRGNELWQNLAGDTYSIPLSNLLAPFKVAEPLPPGHDGMSSSPQLVVSEDGTLHFTATVSGYGIYHYVKTPESEVLTQSTAPATVGFAAGGRVFSTRTISSTGRFVISSTPQESSNWRDDLSFTPSVKFANTAKKYYNGKLYMVASEYKNSDKHPFRFLVFDLGVEEPPVDPVSTLKLVDNFDSQSGGTIDGKLPNGELGGLWDTQTEGSTQGGSIQAIHGTQTLKVIAHSSGGGRGSAFNGLSDTIKDNEKGILFYRFSVASNNGNPVSDYMGFHVKTGDNPLANANDLSQIVAGFAIANSGGASNDPYDVMTLDKQSVLVSGLQRGLWYNAWIVADNATDTYDVYLSEATGPTGDATMPSIPNDAIAAGLPFRAATSDPLTGGMFIAKGGTNQPPALNIDEIWWNGSMADRAGVLENPQDLFAVLGADAEFSALFSEESDLEYQWFRSADNSNATSEDDAAVGSNSSLLIINAVTGEDAGYYYCVGTSIGGSVATEPARLVVGGLVAHWTLDQDDYQDGHYLDMSGEGHHAMANGTASFVDGQIHQAVEIVSNANGALNDNWATAGTWNPSELSGQLTVSFWLNWAGVNGTYQSFVAKRNGDWTNANVMWQISTGSNATNIQLQSPNGTVSADGVLAGTEGQWVYVVVTYDGTTTRIYINGKPKAEDGGFQFGDATAALLALGCNGGDREWMNGKLDDVRIYNYALNEFEVATEYYEGSGNAVCVASIKPIYDFNDNCVVDLEDLMIFADGWLECGWIPICDIPHSTAP